MTWRRGARAPTPARGAREALPVADQQLDAAVERPPGGGPVGRPRSALAGGADAQPGTPARLAQRPADHLGAGAAEPPVGGGGADAVGVTDAGDALGAVQLGGERGDEAAPVAG